MGDATMRKGYRKNRSFKKGIKVNTGESLFHQGNARLFRYAFAKGYVTALMQNGLIKEKEYKGAVFIPGVGFVSGPLKDLSRLVGNLRSKVGFVPQSTEKHLAASGV